MDFNQLSFQVAEVARRAGQFIRQEAASFDLGSVESKGFHDLVSYVDKQSEKQLVDELRQLLPEAGFITEEGTEGAERAENLNWIIDPLDGTTNFIHGLPAYCVSIALIQGAELVIGVVYEITRDECFRAALGAGAFCNEKPIHVSAANDLHNTLIATGFPYYKFDKLDGYLQILSQFMQNTQGIRRVGSAAMDLAYVAAGRFDCYFEFNINSYDVAAGILLVREAGGRVTQFTIDGDPVFSREVVATNGHIHEATQDIIRKYWS
ncbi:inositol monophosphatase family protein [Hymenobacter cavernae]|uniref:Inositol-1-monophosphatase n=1 Tax=Hymenobacter cavernae TaxID=2044852 RepID=A0ABQ1TTY7_9BACT|nr:inositol monophosphatase family protein [Hymenobacter cavernae]GGF03306.1 inositol monophosphatase [Hymenobacter cavernae]